MKLEGRFQPAGYLNDLPLVPPPPELAALGWANLKRIDLRWGCHDEALSTVIRVVAPAPRQGITALFDQPTFEKDSLRLCPGLTDFTVVSTMRSKHAGSDRRLEEERQSQRRSGDRGHGETGLCQTLGV